MTNARLQMSGGISLGMTTEDGGYYHTLLLPPVDERLAGEVGRVVTHWSQLERLIDGLTDAILLFQGKTVPGWKLLPTKARIRLFVEESNAVFGDRPAIMKTLRDATAKCWKAKRIRDLICHSQIVSHVGDDAGPGISFSSSSFGKKSRPLRQSDLSSTVRDIGTTCAALLNLSEAERSRLYSSEDRDLLRRALGKVPHPSAP